MHIKRKIRTDLRITLNEWCSHEKPYLARVVEQTHVIRTHSVNELPNTETKCYVDRMTTFIYTTPRRINRNNIDARILHSNMYAEQHE